MLRAETLISYGKAVEGLYSSEAATAVVMPASRILRMLKSVPNGSSLAETMSFEWREAEGNSIANLHYTCGGISLTGQEIEGFLQFEDCDDSPIIGMVTEFIDAIVSRIASGDFAHYAFYPLQPNQGEENTLRMEALHRANLGKLPKEQLNHAISFMIIYSLNHPHYMELLDSFIQRIADSDTEILANSLIAIHKNYNRELAEVEALPDSEESLDHYTQKELPRQRLSVLLGITENYLQKYKPEYVPVAGQKATQREAETSTSPQA